MEFEDQHTKHVIYDSPAVRFGEPESIGHSPHHEAVPGSIEPRLSLSGVRAVIARRQLNKAREEMRIRARRLRSDIPPTSQSQYEHSDH